MLEEYKCKFSNCGRKFENINHYNEHLKRRHPNLNMP